MTDLSPAAQAVLDAVVSHPTFATRKRIGRSVPLQQQKVQLAAALQAAADHVECDDPDDNAFSAGYYAAVNDILAIATELEGAYLNGNDVHARTARLLLEKDEVSADERRLGKTINFGVIYGMGAQPEGTDG